MAAAADDDRRIGIFGAPRPMPGKFVPIAAAAGVVLLALPVFLVAGWPIGAWGLAAVLFAGSQGLGLLLGKLGIGTDKLAQSGVMAFGMMFRAVAVMVVLLVVAMTNKNLGLGAAIVYALAYSMELGVSVISYFGGPEK